jgi:hypothetical protein
VLAGVARAPSVGSLRVQHVCIGATAALQSAKNVRSFECGRYDRMTSGFFDAFGPFA